MSLLLLFLLGAMAISFLCSLLESTLMSTPLSYITMREEEGSKDAARFNKLKQNIDRPIAAILSLNTIANTIGAAGVGRQATIIFGSEWFGLVSAIMTILILVFSEIIPKTIGTSRWKGLLWLANVMNFLVIIMYPLVVLIEFLTRLFEKEEADVSISREEVSAMANIGEEEGVFDKSENKVIQNIIKLDDIKAYDVMTPRVVAAIAPEKMTLRKFYKEEALSHYSRIPVYSDSPEFITGYVHRYDVLEKLAEDKFDVTLKDIKREIRSFNEETSVSDIWESLLKTRDQIGVIIDEYGSFQGLITLEDIIETIMGMEIIDESDTVTDMQQYARERWQQRMKQYNITIPDFEDSDSDNPGREETETEA
ncbi:MAG: HlyC/CorC family transporter [Bacteroidales bacterium]|nr:HlyC/CorC family transporter [Bacteroidales bacterium]MBR5955240.1 HlyC/CorC family transporter [Bacteroidales bacterium]